MRFQSFPIDGKRLRELRKTQGLTQAEMALRICEKLNLADQDEDVATSIYRRIEKRGSTSRDRAQAIADILAISLDDLQGLRPPEPEIYEQRIYTLLKSQIDANSNPAILRELERTEEESPEEALKCVAKYVAARIEGAQLCRNPADLAELKELTGLDVNELLRPANCSGHWFISAFGAGIDSAQIISGIFGFWLHMDLLVKEQLNCSGTDARISLRRESPWYRIEIELPGSARLPQSMKVIRINIVRCQPDDKGVRWIPPTWVDDWLMTDTLENWARQYGNFIQTFDNPLIPCNIGNLCLQVTEFQYAMDKQIDALDNQVGQTVIRLDMDSTHHSVKHDTVENALSHALVISQLQGDLHTYLDPIISSSPRGRWSLMESQGGLSIEFWPQLITTDSSYWIRYIINLVEEISPNDFRHLPWRERDRKTFREVVEKWLN